MGTTTFLQIPVVKGELGLIPDFPGGVRKLAANAVTQTFNKAYIVEMSSVSAAVTAATGVQSLFKYADPSKFAAKLYESTLTVAAIIALDA
jgi:hypothetical protein